MASLGKACFAGRHLSQPGTHCPRSGHYNYSVVLPVYYPLFFSLVYDHPVILIHNIIFFSSLPHGQLWALEKVLNHIATVGLLSYLNSAFISSLMQYFSNPNIISMVLEPII
jgi:hypothetical protein